MTVGYRDFLTVYSDARQVVAAIPHLHGGGRGRSTAGDVSMVGCYIR